MMQMVMSVAAIANGGRLYQPHLVHQLIKPDGSVKAVEPKVVNQQVISTAAARQLTDMMAQVVEHGSGWPARTKGYRIAGKTGTAQIPRADGQGYDENKNIGSFVGFLPADNPKFVLMVRINQPQVAGFAESTTVPVFAKIANWLIKYYAISPSS
jgi:cell division protein FtsI/penicillin-binding protein 2